MPAPEQNQATPTLLARIDPHLPTLYLLLGLTLTTLLCFLTAPFFGPDEPDQSLRAIALSHGHLIEPIGPTEAGDFLDTGAIHAMDGIDDLRIDWERSNRDFLDRAHGPVPPQAQRKLAAIRWTRHNDFVGFSNTAAYPPLLYLPAILGWRTGEAANLTIFQSLRLARLLCAFTAIGLGFLALRLCAFPRWLLLPTLLLPSTLFLNATSSQDSVLISVAALAIALLSRPLSAQRNFTRPELIATATLLALCALARPPYAALALVLFLPTLEARSPTKKRSPPTLAFAAVLAACALWRSLVAPLGVELSDAANPTQQAAFLLHHPFSATAAVLRGTASAAFDFFHRGLYVLGWNDLLPHHGAAAALTACLALICLFAPPIPIRTMPARALLLAAVTAPLLGISLAEYFIWTPPAWHTVYGIQPRYWLPILPLATLLLQSLPKPKWLATIRTLPLLLATATLALIACTLPWASAHAFYPDSLSHVLNLNFH
jgi:uncharacterized membrane protein